MPVEIAALASDTTLVKNCFTNLEIAFDYFEDSFGPYRWEKVGYSIVPFNSGAMEHATNISYPRPFIDNAGTYEADLMAHELAHQWFGDMVTARCEPHHWLQESFATHYNMLAEREFFGQDHFDWARRNAQNAALDADPDVVTAPGVAILATSILKLLASVIV
jgi:aminopeptidase N